jgi:uncharacterized protein
VTSPETARGRICVFAKTPEAGGVKTRLGLTDAAAASLATAFFQDTWAQLAALSWARPVAALNGEPSALGGAPGGEVWEQGDGDLGARLERVLHRALNDGPWAIALGADTPGLPAQRLEEARDALRTFDAVLGPSEDGGFYLLGLSRCPEGLLNSLPWSEPDTFVSTHQRLQQLGLEVAVLPKWFDLDRPDDLQRFKRMLERGEVIAPRSQRALEALLEQ